VLSEEKRPFHPATFALSMRHPFTAQSEFGLVPIEKIVLPLKSRDELPPILAGLQWIWSHPTLKAEILALLEAKILAGKKATDQHELVQDYTVLLGEAEVDQSIPVADRLLHRYGADSLASLSFDKGFTRTADRELLHLYVPTVVMPKRGKKNATETAQENEKTFVALRHQHSAVESDINSLEHHGLSRCLDVGLAGYQRYAGYGILAYNLHVIGRELQDRARCRDATEPAAA